MRGGEEEERRLLDHRDVLWAEGGEPPVPLQRIGDPAPVETVLKRAVTVVEHRSRHGLPHPVPRGIR